MKDIVVLLLAAGDSNRMWPIGDKHFLEFAGKPLIHHSLSQLYRWGFRNFVIVANSENKSNFHNFKSIFKDANIFLVVQTDKKGMAGAILTAKKFIIGKRVLVVGPSDIYEDLLLSEFKRMITSSPDGIITGITMETYFPGGYLNVSGGKVSGISEKPHPSVLPSNIVTFVFDYFKNANLLICAIEKIGTDKDDCFEKSVDLMIKKGNIFRLLHYKGFWGYLKYPWHVLNVTSYYLDNLELDKMKNVVIDKSATISGKVYLGENVRILENAKVVGPAFIGPGCVVGNNSIVRESMIGNSCVIGFGCEIARSHIGDSCWFHSNYVGDSVISDNVSLGAGSVLANFRLDEGIIKSRVGKDTVDTGKIKLGSVIGENVRIGVNVSIMPGVKIGKNSFVGAGVVLDCDLPENKYCVLEKKQYTIKDNLLEIPKGNRSKQREKLKFS
jgi:bifunctional UDP-N-acetylglucosamine pyrophosphorylase/glucosamine-1-phosphate N-acetyltransferase